MIVRFYFDTMLETYKRLLSEDRRRQRLQHLLGAAIRLSQRHVVRRLLRDRDTRHLKLLDANEGGNEPLRFADDEVIIRAIVESPGYSPTANFVCRTGKSLLHYLCDCKPHPGLYGKVNDLFLKSAPVAGSAVVRQQQKRPPVFEPGEGKDLVLTADQSHNFDLVWILLREGPIDDVDLNTIDFFRAVRDGHDRDGEEEISGDTFMHVFAKIGFYRGIAYAQKHFERDYEEYLTVRNIYVLCGYTYVMLKLTCAGHMCRLDRPLPTSKLGGQPALDGGGQGQPRPGPRAPHLPYLPGHTDEIRNHPG